ncbi:hypothetical protein QO002_005758 [Pararhizobium capsulatum DSM 1112]|uniref:Dehydrogenase n=1 Tax=Pararhizobium capsulatum DSM 1112 TaxID=1121113 RepID=A0ABU0C037_9HYPH|nr:hypothetical protein [Pararhizobium capsulatum]MDQ0323552.1 hypothetical protein [Pararhizobium capsulatum DSM 1112]
MSAETHETIFAGPVDEIASVLAWHDGDVRASIRTLLGDLKQAREQLAFAELIMGTGFSRGWKPSTGTAKEIDDANSVQSHAERETDRGLLDAHRTV